MATETTESGGLKVAIENTRTWARRLTITVPSERVENERKAVARRIASQIRLPGFRKGKVPTDVLEKKYGPAIEQETLEKIVGAAYKEAIEQEGLQPITQGSVDKLDYSRGQDLTFNVELEVRPEVELNRLGGFTVTRPSTDVGDDQVDRVIERLRLQNAVWQPEERAPVLGDRVSVEITALNPHDAGEARPRRYDDIVLGQGEIVPTVEEAVRSLKPGEEGEFTLEVHTEEGGTEHEHRARIKLLEVKSPILPAVDDEFARSLGEFDDLATLRERVREDLGREVESEAERAVRGQLLEQVLEANPFEVPDAMVAQYLEQMIRPRKGADEEQLQRARMSAWPAAEQQIRRMLVIDKIAELEGLHATAADVDARIEELAGRYNRTPVELRKQLQKSGQLGQLEEEITEERVFSYLKSLSSIE